MADRLVGRERELELLSELLADATAGRGRMGVVVGDAGIGKSALAATLAATAARSGITVASGRCPETEALPFWPWRQALRALDAAGPLDDETAAGRPTVFADVADRLGRATADTPALLIIEDVHLCDGPSLALLQFLVGVVPELRCMLLLTCRENPLDVDPAAADVLAALPSACVRVALGGLSRTDIHLLVAQTLGHPDDGVGDAVFQRCGGNPLFAKELALLQAARGAAPAGPPIGVQQVLGRRLARLDQRAHDCLAAAAVLGEDVPVAVLAGVLGRPEAEVVDQLGDAVRAGLATLDGPRVRFAHSLVREVVYGALGAARRSVLHERAAEALARRQESAATVAEHYRKAPGQPGAAERARAFAVSAARSAMRRAGYEQAVRMYGWALDGVDPDPDLLQGLGEAQVLAGEMTAGRATLRALARQCLESGAGEPAARALLAMGGGVGGFEVDLMDDEHAAMLTRALELLPAEESSVHAATLARSALARFHGGDVQRARDLARRAVDMARRLGDATTEAAAIAAWCDTASGPDFVADRATEARRMLGLAETRGDLTLVLLARRLLVVALLESGEFDAADEQIGAYARGAEQLRVPYFAWPVPVWRGMRALMRHDVDTTDACIESAMHVAQAAQSTNAELMVATLQLARADVTETMPARLSLIDKTFGPFLESPMAQAYLAYFLLKAGERDRAAGLLEQRMSAGGPEAIGRDAEWLTCVCLLGETAAALGAREAVAACLAAVRPYRRLWLFDGIGAGCYGSVEQRIARFEAFLAGAPDRAAGRAEIGELRRSGPVWTVRWRDREMSIADAKGVRDIAALLARPRTPVHVLDLVGTDPGALGAGLPALDEQARSAYQQRLRDLAGEISEAEEFADAGRLERLRAEHEFLAAELAAALGLGGRPRTSADPVERARKAVSMRIAAAIKSIDRVDPALGRHLKASIRTGRLCVYEPEDEVSWRT